MRALLKELNPEGDKVRVKRMRESRHKCRGHDHTVAGFAIYANSYLRHRKTPVTSSRIFSSAYFVILDGLSGLRQDIAIRGENRACILLIRPDEV